VICAGFRHLLVGLAAAAFTATGALAQDKPPPQLVPKLLHGLLPLSIELQGWKEAGWLDRVWYLPGTAWHFIISKELYFGDFYLIKDAMGAGYPEDSWTKMAREHPIFTDSKIEFGPEVPLKTVEVSYRYAPFRVSNGRSKAYCLYTVGLWKPGLLEGFVCHPSRPFTDAAASIFLRSIAVPNDVSGTPGMLE
jgi:hypothetical protein